MKRLLLILCISFVFLSGTAFAGKTETYKNIKFAKAVAATVEAGNANVKYMKTGHHKGQYIVSGSYDGIPFSYSFNEKKKFTVNFTNPSIRSGYLNPAIRDDLRKSAKALYKSLTYVPKQKKYVKKQTSLMPSIPIPNTFEQLPEENFDVEKRLNEIAIMASATQSYAKEALTKHKETMTVLNDRLISLKGEVEKLEGNKKQLIEDLFNLEVDFKKKEVELNRRYQEMELEFAVKFEQLQNKADSDLATYTRDIEATKKLAEDELALKEKMYKDIIDDMGSLLTKHADNIEKLQSDILESQKENVYTDAKLNVSILLNVILIGSILAFYVINRAKKEAQDVDKPKSDPIQNPLYEDEDTVLLNESEEKVYDNPKMHCRYYCEACNDSECNVCEYFVDE